MKTSRCVQGIGRAAGEEGGAEVWLEPGAGVAWPECGRAVVSGHYLLQCNRIFIEKIVRI